ncbi:hypothetical protein ES703_78982 [subsurface metagenome]
MKNSKEYSKKIQRLHRSLSRKYPKVQKVIYDEPADAIVYAIISAELSEKATATAIKKLADYFVDLNDLRVSRTEEIVEMLGADTSVTRTIASTITTVLRAVFNEYHKVSLEVLKKIGKRPARQILEKLEGISRFVVDYCMLTSLQGHAIPLTKGMIEYLKSKELVYPDADEQQIGGFLTKQISANKGYDFYALLRRESEARRSKKKKKSTTTSKKKTETKSKKKTTKKRKSKK